MAKALSSRPRPITSDSARLVLRRMPGLGAVAVMAVIGFLISIYLTTVHYQKQLLVCSASGTIDCASVLNSPYGLIPGTKLPITFPGMLWFLVSGGIAVWVLVAAMRGTRPPEWWSTALKGWGVIGLLSVLYLVYAEIVKLHHICAWCTIIHTLVVATLIVAFMQDTSIPALPPLAKGTAKASGTAKSAANGAKALPGATKTTSATKSALSMGAKTANGTRSATPSRPAQATSRPLTASTSGSRPSGATKAKTPVASTSKKTR